MTIDSADELNQIIGLIANWRQAHGYPLHSITMGLRQRARSVDANAIVVQRLKRLPSIIPKLERGLNLTQIQDIGGCRAVLKDMSRLDAVHLKHSSREFDFMLDKSYLNAEPKNYILEPKADEYRSIHYVFRYLSGLPKYKCFDGMKIEVQLRTQAQHSWATALEIVDFFTGERLKTDIERNESNPVWKVSVCCRHLDVNGLMPLT